MKGLFTVNTAAYVSDEEALYRPINVFIGDVNQTFMAMQNCEGEQALRTQVDVAADGSPYIIVGGQGIGQQRLVFFDGPYAACDNAGSESILKTTLSMKDLTSRKLSVNVFSGGVRPGENLVVTGRFTGIVNNMRISVADTNGGMFVVVTLSAIGAWDINAEN